MRALQVCGREYAFRFWILYVGSDKNSNPVSVWLLPGLNQYPLDIKEDRFVSMLRFRYVFVNILDYVLFNFSL